MPRFLLLPTQGALEPWGACEKIKKVKKAQLEYFPHLEWCRASGMAHPWVFHRRFGLNCGALIKVCPELKGAVLGVVHEFKARVVMDFFFSKWNLRNNGKENISRNSECGSGNPGISEVGKVLQDHQVHPGLVFRNFCPFNLPVFPFLVGNSKIALKTNGN